MLPSGSYHRATLLLIRLSTDCGGGPLVSIADNVFAVGGRIEGKRVRCLSKLVVRGVRSKARHVRYRVTTDSRRTAIVSLELEADSNIAWRVIEFGSIHAGARSLPVASDRQVLDGQPIDRTPSH